MQNDEYGELTADGCPLPTGNLMNRLILCGLAIFGFVTVVAPTNVDGQTRQAFERDRNRMVDQEIVDAGIKNPRVIEAMRRTPRHEFMPLSQRKYAYLDMALPIGDGQTISPPFVVAYMTEQLDPQPTDKVLEIGTGSGYQAAVLSGLVREVYTIEIVEPLGRRAGRTLKQLKYENVHAKVDDGFKGWPEHAPFDKIIVTCSPESVPVPLVQQLKEGGRMVIPCGERYKQNLYMLKKVNGQLVKEDLHPTLFVPMTGEAEQRRRIQPDPNNPEVHNGDFEEVSGDPPEPTGWHYQRQLELMTDNEAPSGKNYITFKNSDPGRGAQALQGMAVNGREVHELKVSLHVRGDDIRPGQNASQLPALLVAFYDEIRNPVGEGTVGPWRGTFAWQQKTAVIDVPPRAREAVIYIGMRGAVGKLSLDDIKIEAQKK
jgi:protein-L-isoaspartate(D-aspartate) O-methyltransferase